MSMIPGLTVDGYPVVDIDVEHHMIQGAPVDGFEVWERSGLPPSITVKVPADSPLLKSPIGRLVTVRWQRTEVKGYLTAVGYAGEDDDMGGTKPSDPDDGGGEE